MIGALMSPRLYAMTVKEFLAVLRDPRGRVLLFLMPVLQLVLFSAAATLEVKKVTVGVLNHDSGRASAEFVQELGASSSVKRIIILTSERDLAEALNRQSMLGAFVIGQQFSADVAAKRPATIQFILDGRRSNAAQIFAAYATQIAANTGAALRPEMRAPPPVIVTNWFNANLDYLWFIMPGLVVQVGAMSALSISAQSVSRERELGTFEQLVVSPLQTWEVILGKLIPPFVIGFFNGTLFLIIVPIVFGVPFRGSLPLFYLVMAVSLFSVLGMGMLVSTIAKTQQQAFLGLFAILPPMTLTSGFTSPAENMPHWLQTFAQANPLLHFNVMMNGLFLRNMPISAVLDNLWPQIAIGVVTIAIAVQQFRARME